MLNPRYRKFCAIFEPDIRGKSEQLIFFFIIVDFIKIFYSFDEAKFHTANGTINILFCNLAHTRTHTHIHRGTYICYTIRNNLIDKVLTGSLDIQGNLKFSIRLVRFGLESTTEYFKASYVPWIGVFKRNKTSSILLKAEIKTLSPIL